MHPAFATSSADAGYSDHFCVEGSLGQRSDATPRRSCSPFCSRPAAFWPSRDSTSRYPRRTATSHTCLFGLGEESDQIARSLSRPGKLPGLLPPGTYRFANAPHDIASRNARLRARQAIASTAIARPTHPKSRLVPPDGVDIADISRMAEAASLARDLINTPANDMGPEELAAAAQHLAQRFGGKFSCIVGDDLMQQNFPLIHAVGMASTARAAPDRYALGRSLASRR